MAHPKKMEGILVLSGSTSEAYRRAQCLRVLAHHLVELWVILGNDHSHVDMGSPRPPSTFSLKSK